MIKIENYEVVGCEHALRGMRNPKNSWGRSDSGWRTDFEGGVYYEIGKYDHKLAMSLAEGGPVHAKYRRMITVYVDITAPLYWWKEFDTYKVGTVANSCSTMHKLTEKEFTLEDFSCEHLMVFSDQEIPYEADWPNIYNYKGLLEDIVAILNDARHKYLDIKARPTKDLAKKKELMKKYWLQMIQLLPSSYNQKRTVMLNYEVLTNIYKWRKDHKLDEWREFCEWIERLPYSEMITGRTNENISTPV